MPVIWQSSQEPMYVRTIWVQGFRHAVITKDDPFYKRNSRQNRPRLSYTKPQNRQSRFTGKRNENINFVVTNNRPIEFEKVIEHDIESLNLTELEPEDELQVSSKPAPLNEFDTHRSKFENLDMRTLRSNRTARTETKESTDLSDRVLQWLDLAGKTDLLAPESDESKRLTQPRHSWPEIRKQTIIQKKEETAKNTEVEMQRDIDRLAQVPSASTTIENYARQSQARQVRVSREPARNRDNKTKTIELRVKIQETRQRVEAEKQEVQKQYAELLSKKILPETPSRKQVHIFMPVSKKTNSNLSAITESLLSQAS